MWKLWREVFELIVGSICHEERCQRGNIRLSRIDQQSIDHHSWLLKTVRREMLALESMSSRTRGTPENASSQDITVRFGERKPNPERQKNVLLQCMPRLLPKCVLRKKNEVSMTDSTDEKRK